VKGSAFLLAFVLLASAVFPADLSLAPEDLIIEQSLEGGYLLRIRQKPGVNSVLVTESTEDPEREVATYAFRNPAFHPLNGEERRVLNGEFLPPEMHFLVDSTPAPDPELGKAFHVFVPYVVEYGYPWSRQGERLIVDGAYLNVRTFEATHASYAGAFLDNPFVLRVTQAPMAVTPETPMDDRYMPATARSYEDIARESDGVVRYSEGEEDLVTQIGEIIAEVEGGSIDLVLALDATQSMENDVPALRRSLVPLLQSNLEGFERFRIGIVYYKDYMEDYLTRTVAFQNDLSVVQRAIDGLRVAGGRDIPEAVHEALYAAVVNFPWMAENRLVILVGDAPPHARPRGSVTEEMVYAAAREHNVRLNTIILPH
jgi:hypothetical protein